MTNDHHYFKDFMYLFQSISKGHLSSLGFCYTATATNYYTQISLKLIFLYLFNLSLKDKLKEEPGEISAGLNNQWSDDQKMISQSVGHL